MSNPYNAVQNALDSIFGPTQATPWAPSASLASASGEGVISSVGPLKLFGITYLVTAANNTLDLRLVDASATAIQTPVNFQIKALSSGFNVVTLPRPIKFNSGMCFMACATGTALPQIYLHWGM